MQFELVDDFVAYASNGTLTWKARTLEIYVKHGLAARGIPNLDRWNETNEGKPAFGMMTGSGGLYGEFFGKRLAADRIAWLLNSKKWPDFYLHHINGNKADNRMENLASVRSTDLLEQRLKNGWRSTDRLIGKWNATWVLRDGVEFQKVDSGNRSPSELDAMMRHLNMVH